MLEGFCLRIFNTCNVVVNVVDGLFNHFVNNQEFQAKWSRIEPVNRDGSDHRPGQRGGHQMVINPYSGQCK